jgi:hypothetical protein
VATAPLNVTPLHSVVEPEVKVTTPPGVPPNCPVTVAVKVVDWLKLEGFGVEVTLVVVLALFTTWLSGDEVLVLKFESPL